jgi:hypothetical protein
MRGREYWRNIEDVFARRPWFFTRPWRADHSLCSLSPAQNWHQQPCIRSYIFYATRFRFITHQYQILQSLWTIYLPASISNVSKLLTPFVCCSRWTEANEKECFNMLRPFKRGRGVLARSLAIKRDTDESHSRPRVMTAKGEFQETIL